MTGRYLLAPGLNMHVCVCVYTYVHKYTTQLKHTALK